LLQALGVEKQRVKVVLSLQNPPKALDHGYRVDARVTLLERPNAMLLPVESLIRTAQGWRAWVLE
jgi:multidrug efflux pump subunit AcrA (membrane-fusion protein)